MMPGILGDVLLNILQPLVENVQASQNLDTRDRGMADIIDIPESSKRPGGHERPLKYPEEPLIKIFSKQDPIRVSTRGSGSRNQGPMGYLVGINVQLDPEGVEVHENPMRETNKLP